MGGGGRPVEDSEIHENVMVMVKAVITMRVTI